LVPQDEEVLVELLELLVRLGCVADWCDDGFIELQDALEVVHGVQRVEELEARALGVATVDLEVWTEVRQLALATNHSERFGQLRHADQIC